MVRLKDVEGFADNRFNMKFEGFIPSIDEVLQVGVEQIGQREIGLNREKLAAMLFNFIYSYECGSHYEDSMNWGDEIPVDVRNKFYERADFIISAEASILEFRQEKGKVECKAE